VYIDLLTDSGTSAMSDRQWAGLMLGDEAYAGSRNYYHLEEAVRKYYGYKYLVPTHQGRGAENILSRILIKPGDILPGNMYFTTTKAHQELAGGTFVDIIVDEAHDPRSLFPFKGNVDLAKLQRVIDEQGAERIPYVSLATTVNMAGGQPISLANLKAVRALTAKHGIRIIHDMTRVAENAYMIQQLEEGQGARSVAEIVFDICSLTDGATMSAKKDALVNIGGFMATNEWDVFEEARNQVVLYEGLHTYGGLAGRDMEAMAIGIAESVQDDHIRARVGQVFYLGREAARSGGSLGTAYRNPRRVPRREGLPAPPAADRLPRTDPGGRDLCGLRRAHHGARHRERWSRQAHRGPLLSGTGTGAPHHPAPRVHPGPHGCDRRVGGPRVRPP
jgi:tyrosine phenol-lyase